MQFALTLPLLFFRFWFVGAPLSMLGYFVSLNKATNQMFSLTLLLKTFFRPWKNEYRKGLVGFSRFMGMLIKTCIIFADIVVFAVLLVFELSVLLLFVAFPFITIALVFLH